MELKEALQKSLKADKRTHTDPFLLHSRVCDLVGSNYEAKKAAEEFYRLDAKYNITETIESSVPVRYKERKKLRYKIKPMPQPADKALVFYDTSTATVHLWEKCPNIHAETIRCVSYAKAKRLDVCRKYPGIPWWTFAHKKLAQKDSPNICRRCGGFLQKAGERCLL